MRKKGMTKFSDQQCADVESMVRVLPNVTLDAHVGVLSNDEDDEREVAWEDKVGPQDVCTCRFELKRAEGAGDDRNKAKGAAGDDANRDTIVHAPYFPFQRDEAWMVILTIPNEKTQSEIIIGMTKITSGGKAEKLMFQPPQQPGTYKFTLHLKSDCYLGFDQKQTLTLKVSPVSDIPVAKHHPEDEDLDNDLTFMQQLAGDLNQEEEPDSDFDESDDEDESETGLSEQQKKKRAARQARKDAKDKKTEDGDQDADMPLSDSDDDDFEMVE